MNIALNVGLTFYSSPVRSLYKPVDIYEVVGSKVNISSRIFPMCPEYNQVITFCPMDLTNLSEMVRCCWEDLINCTCCGEHFTRGIKIFIFQLKLVIFLHLTPSLLTVLMSSSLSNEMRFIMRYYVERTVILLQLNVITKIPSHEY